MDVNAKFQMVIEYFKKLEEFVGAEVRGDHIYVYVNSRPLALELQEESHKYGISILSVLPKRQR